MAKFIGIKRLDGSILPAYNSDYEIVSKLKVGEPYEYEVKKKRNSQFHKKYMALLNMVFINQNNAKNFNEFRKDIAIGSGYYIDHVDIYGNEVKRAKSISFANMDNIEFQQLYSKSIDVIIETILPCNTKEEIIENVINFM